MFLLASFHILTSFSTNLRNRHSHAPVNGHWSNKMSLATVLTVGALRMPCSLIKQKARSKAPVHAKMKSITKYDIINRFVILAIGLSSSNRCVYWFAEDESYLLYFESE